MLDQVGLLANDPYTTLALRFDKVFAFNVAPFWLEPNDALEVVREHLAPGGAVYVFWDARRQTASDLGERLGARLLQGGFAIDRVLGQKAEAGAGRLRDRQGLAPRST